MRTNTTLASANTSPWTPRASPRPFPRRSSSSVTATGSSCASHPSSSRSATLECECSRVSVDASGGDSNSDSAQASISADGRFVAFSSSASDLVPGDRCCSDIFVRDRQMAVTTRVSVDTAGRDANDASAHPSISGDGRYVAFYSFASDLVPGDGNGTIDVFVRDRQDAITGRASLGFFGGEANGPSLNPSISADAHYVAFASSANNLVAGDRFAEAIGVTVNSVTVVSETQWQVSVTVDAGAPTGERTLTVWNLGTGPGSFAAAFGVCFHCLTVT